MSHTRPLITTARRLGCFILVFWGGLSCPVSAGELADIGAGHIRFEGQSTALHLESAAQFRINGLIAHVTLEQQFRNQSSDWQEGIYVLPLPDEAAVNEMEMQIGQRLIKAEIKEKVAARKIYQAATAAGKKAALVEQSRPNLFQQAVANIAPGETIVVRISFVQPVQYDRGQFSIRFPMTITPRYMPGSPTGAAVNSDLLHSPNTTGWALATTEVPDAPLISVART